MRTVLCVLINISENKDGKKNEGSYLSCVTNGEFYSSTLILIGTLPRNQIFSQLYCATGHVVRMY